MRYFTYILLNNRNTTIYVGVTNSLQRRMYQHKNKFFKNGFSAQYNVCKLVYYEEYPSAVVAIRREKQLKNWHREWKLNLVKASNPSLNDLAADWFDVNQK